jgi:alkanesulfonate monooxygenase SsuD/methylene tetrahydromethanopterin reductase-like flavin-dependent oxidoreductase (luciferase family)
MGDGPPVGLVLGSAIAPEQLVRTALLGEELGFGELWFAEDYFFTGGISGATAALGATERIPVGLGIVSAMVRHPALLAMEIATTARMYPGRLWPGIGLGVPYWVNQMRLMPASQIGAMRECVTSVRALLDGEELTVDGATFGFDHVKLTYPGPDERVPLYMGVIGPKMLELSGEIADGTVLSVLGSTEYVRWVRERIASGAARAKRSDHHRVVAFVFLSLDRNAAKAKEALRGLMAFYLAAMPDNALTQTYGIVDELRDMLARGGAPAVEREMPGFWIDDLAVGGDPDECAAKIKSYLDAGADSVALFPVPTARAHETVRLASAEILPRLR